MLKLKKILPHKFQSYIVFGIIIFSLVNLINSIVIKITFINLVENQILYIYSALAQVIGALLGLTIAGYSIIDSKLKTFGESDSTVTDIIDDLRTDYFSSLMTVIILSAIDILFCLFILCIYNNFLNILSPFFMNQSIIIFVFIMIEIIYFVNFLNPIKIREKGSADKERIEKSFKKTTSSSSSASAKSASFSSFVTTYNLLEALIREYADKLTGSSYSSYKTPFFDAINILLKYEIINRETLSIIDELRRYRNALVHSLETDKSVNPDAYNKLENIYKKLKDIYDINMIASNNSTDESEQNSLFLEKQNNLKNYTKSLGFGEMENRIINYFEKHDYASIYELSEYLNLSRNSTIKVIKNLQEIGILENTGTSQRTRWALKK